MPNRKQHDFITDDERLTAADKKVLNALASKSGKGRISTLGSVAGGPLGVTSDEPTTITGPRTGEVVAEALQKFRTLQLALNMGDPDGEVEQLSELKPEGVSKDLLQILNRKKTEDESGLIERN